MPTQVIPRTRKRRLSDDEIAAWEAFVRAYAVTTHALERASETRGGLPFGEHFLLVQIARGPQSGMRPTDLATRSLLTKSGLTRAIDRLVADGLVERRICPTDRRGQLLALSTKGRRLLRRAAPSHFRAIATHFADPLTADELAVLTRALGRIAAADPRS